VIVPGTQFELRTADGATLAVTACPGGKGCNSLVPTDLLPDHLANWHGLTSLDDADSQAVTFPGVVDPDSQTVTFPDSG
jgi:hypothetical protein